MGTKPSWRVASLATSAKGRGALGSGRAAAAGPAAGGCAVGLAAAAGAGAAVGAAGAAAATRAAGTGVAAGGVAQPATAAVAKASVVRRKASGAERRMVRLTSRARQKTKTRDFARGARGSQGGNAPRESQPQNGNFAAGLGLAARACACPAAGFELFDARLRAHRIAMALRAPSPQHDAAIFQKVRCRSLGHHSQEPVCMRVSSGNRLFRLAW
jgi:hypothetical protein